jgi:hypothetical protein
MRNFGLRESAVVPSRTLVAADGNVWIWPGIPLTARQGKEIVAKSTDTIRFWITRWHGPEALHTEAVHFISEAARWLTYGNEAGAQRVLDSAGLKKISLDGAALMRRVAGRLGLPLPDFEYHPRPRAWTTANIDFQLDFIARNFDIGAPLEKFIPFDSLKHPRWPHGAPDSQGGEFKDKDGSDAEIVPAVEPENGNGRIVLASDSSESPAPDVAARRSRILTLHANAARGREAEKRVLQDLGLPKNTRSVTTAEGDAVPDVLTDSLLGEIKDQAYIRLTKQLRIESGAAKASGRQSVLITGTYTKISRSVAELFDRFIQLDDLGPQLKPKPNVNPGGTAPPEEILSRPVDAESPARSSGTPATRGPGTGVVRPVPNPGLIDAGPPGRGGGIGGPNEIGGGGDLVPNRLHPRSEIPDV